MKDLYAIINGNPEMSRSQLNDLVATCAHISEDEKRDCEYVLFTDGIKKLYDDNWRAKGFCLTVLRDLHCGSGILGADDDYAETHKFERADSSVSEMFKKPLLAQLMPNDFIQKFIIKLLIKVSPLLLLFVVGYLISLFSQCSGSEYDYSNANKTNSEQNAYVNNSGENNNSIIYPIQDPGYEEVDLPPTGKIDNKRKVRAPLVIISAQDDDNYYIKLVDSNKTVVAKYFLRARETLNTSAPLGSYYVYIASGIKWYGLKYHFGPNATCSMWDDKLTFTKDEQGYIGHKIELIKQDRGNINEKYISNTFFNEIE